MSSPRALDRSHPRDVFELSSVDHHRWLHDHARQLLEFGRASRRDEGGSAWLDGDGRPDHDAGVHTWITCRMVHVYGLGTQLGIPGCRSIAQSALDGLLGDQYDFVHGGWFTHTAAGVPTSLDKTCYDHAFVLLAACTARHAGLSGAAELFERAASTFLHRFWDPESGRCRDTWDRAFNTLDAYRGLNGNMHAVEAMLAAASLTGDLDWLRRAASVCDFVAGIAESNHWRIPEHFDGEWRPILDFNRDRPADPFKPFGATVGHAFEWARLIIHLANSPMDHPCLGARVQVAEHLFEQAVLDGWAVDGAPGFVYTTDWSGSPVVRDRMHWVLTEAIAAAAVLHHQTNELTYAIWYRTWWEHAAQFHINAVDGSWAHQLDSRNRLASTVWAGRPDLYHAFQATLIPRAPLYPPLSAALESRAAALDTGLDPESQGTI